jgi:hypothetical protein
VYSIHSLRNLGHQRNLPPFIRPEDSLPCSQGPATGPYLEPGEFRQNPHTLSFIMRFNVTSIPKLCLKAFFHFHVFRLHFCARLLSPQRLNLQNTNYVTRYLLIMKRQGNSLDSLQQRRPDSGSTSHIPSLNNRKYTLDDALCF